MLYPQGISSFNIPGIGKKRHSGTYPKRESGPDDVVKGIFMGVILGLLAWAVLIAAFVYVL